MYTERLLIELNEHTRTSQTGKKLCGRKLKVGGRKFQGIPGFSAMASWLLLEYTDDYRPWCLSSQSCYSLISPEMDERTVTLLD